MSENDVVETSFTLRNSFGDPISGELRYVPRGGNQPAIIICHSLMAFKDWGFFPYSAAKIAQAGFVAVTFNFSLNGVVAHGNRITEFSKFERNTFSRELHDLKIVTDTVQRNDFGVQGLDTDRLALLGHSRGGGESIVFSSMDDRVRALVTWSAISTFDRWTIRQKEKWSNLGYLPLAKDSTVSPLRLGIQLLNDYTQQSDRLDITKAASSLRIPWLLLHGKADVIVGSREAETLYASSNKLQTQLVLLDHVGHLYNAASPEEDHYQTFNSILDLTTHWLQQKLT